jgi:hypothetical protein
VPEKQPLKAKTAPYAIAGQGNRQSIGSLFPTPDYRVEFFK